MASGTEVSGSVWARLRDNGEANARLFERAGILATRAGEVVCPRCDGVESALFWTVIRLRGSSLLLRCPFCERAKVRFSLAGNRAWRRPNLRGAMLSAFGLAVTGTLLVGLLIGGDDPLVQRLGERVDAGFRVAGAAARGLSGGLLAGGNEVLEETGAAAAGLQRERGSRSQLGSGGGARAGTSTPAVEVPNPVNLSAPGETRAAASAPSTGAGEVRSTAVFEREGDLRVELAARASMIGIRFGAGEAAALRRMEYDSALNRTRVVVDTGSEAWRSFLIESGWRPSGDG